MSSPRHLYVHVPFCARRCSYCDFSIAVRARVPVEEYVGALRAELQLRHGAEPLSLDTLYFGGGTPSRLGADGVAVAVDAVREIATLAEGAEVTLEANPDDVSPAAAAAWRNAGVNRLSVGGQSFDDRVLAWMHRTHSSSRIAEAVVAARAAGIEDISIDLIFALPETLGRSWERDLDRALFLEPTHLSLYGLTVEQGTPFARWRDRGDVREAAEERYEEEFLRASERLTAAGFRHYEVSNFARPGHEARHNSAYWRGVPYAAVGPSAHAFDGARRRWNVAPYTGWLRALADAGDPSGGEELLTDRDRRAEEIYLGLRTQAGLALRDEGERRLVAPWLGAGWAELRGGDGPLRLTPRGWLRLDALATALTVHRSC